VLFVDDAHLLDDASAVLVHQVAMTGSCFVLATLRTGEPVPESVSALWKDGHLGRLDISGLGPEAIEELVGAAMGGPVGRDAVARLAARCQGNVLFLRELVLGARSAGALSREGGLLVSTTTSEHSSSSWHWESRWERRSWAPAPTRVGPSRWSGKAFSRAGSMGGVCSSAWPIRSTAT
jgi:hypothetical protein